MKKYFIYIFIAALAGLVACVLDTIEPEIAPLWVKTYGGSGEDCGSSVLETGDGGFIIVGHTNQAEPDDGAIEPDVYLVRTNATGDVVWTKTYGGSSSDIGSSIHYTNDGGYIITGQTTSFGMKSVDVYLIRINSNGDTLWTKTYGGTGQDIGHCVRQTSDSGFVVTGRTTSFGSGGYDVYVIRTDSHGAKRWETTCGGSDWDWGESVQQTRDGGFIIAGTTDYFSSLSGDVCLIRFDKDDL